MNRTFDSIINYYLGKGERSRAVDSLSTRVAHRPARHRRARNQSRLQAAERGRRVDAQITSHIARRS